MNPRLDARHTFLDPPGAATDAWPRVTFSSTNMSTFRFCIAFLACLSIPLGATSSLAQVRPLPTDGIVVGATSLTPMDGQFGISVGYSITRTMDAGLQVDVSGLGQHVGPYLAFTTRFGHPAWGMQVAGGYRFSLEDAEGGRLLVGSGATGEVSGFHRIDVSNTVRFLPSMGAFLHTSDQFESAAGGPQIGFGTAVRLGTSAWMVVEPVVRVGFPGRVRESGFRLAVRP